MEIITPEDEELIMRSIHAYQKTGATAPWHLVFHPNQRPEWVQIDAIMTTLGDVHFHPDWACPRESMLIHGDEEWRIQVYPPLSPN